MTVDPEISAISAIVQSLESLEDDDARSRVLSYAATRFGLSAATNKSTRGANNVGAQSEEAGQDADYESLAELFDAASPKTESLKVLVTGYWIQEHEGAADLDALAMNKSLKDLGHGVGNITTALTRLMKVKPALAMQTKKQGTSKQARKKYRLTKAGVTAVQNMLKGVAVE